MKTYTATPDFYRDYICHYNHNHDPRNGQFTSGNGIGGNSGELKKSEQAYKTLKSMDIYDPDYSYDFKNDKSKERAREAADLGNIALMSTRGNAEWASGMKKDDLRMWFLYEDQTIGLPTVADLALQGKTKEEIKNLQKLAKQVDWEHSYEPGIFSLNEGYFDDDYIDKCIDIAKEYRKDKKQIDSADIKDKTTTYGNMKYSEMDLGKGKNKINLWAFKEDLPDKKDFKREAKAFAMGKQEIKKLTFAALKDDSRIKEWMRIYNLSDKEFFNNLDIKSVRLDKDGMIEISVYKDDSNFLGGHEINMEFYSYAPTKPKWISVNG